MLEIDWVSCDIGAKIHLRYIRNVFSIELVHFTDKVALRAFLLSPAFALVKHGFDAKSQAFTNEKLGPQLKIESFAYN